MGWQHAPSEGLAYLDIKCLADGVTQFNQSILPFMMRFGPFPFLLFRRALLPLSFFRVTTSSAFAFATLKVIITV